jgi:hypothetical protein
MSNLVTGHVTLTNSSGLSQNIPVPATARNGLPLTIVVDLSVLTPSAGTRTAGTWNLVIAGNPANVKLGGAIALYGPKTMLGHRHFQWGYTLRKTSMAPEKVNEYGSRFIADTTAMERSIDVQTIATDTDADLLEAWFDGNHGRGLPGLLWLRPDVQDAYFGIWQPAFERTVGVGKVVNTNVIKLTFTELSKGIPFL